MHMVNGIWGTVADGLFSNGGNGVMPGLFYGGGAVQLGTQLMGIVSVAAYVLIVMFIIFKLIDVPVAGTRTRITYVGGYGTSSHRAGALEGVWTMEP